MNREEAINFANCLKNNYTVDLNDMEAFCDMAIKALEQEPTTKNNCAEQNGCITCSLDDGDDCCRKLYEESMQEPTTKNDLGVDCISREQALRELKESAEHHANDSREEALLRRDRDIIRALPSVTPQLSVPEVTALAEWTEKLTKASEDAYNKGFADGMKAQEPKWIPVSEKLPEIHNYTEKYLVTLERGWVRTAMCTECDGNHWWSYDDVIAWMPLPKAYREVKK